ncbi:hypothetical protein B5D77_06360 [Microcystis sp. MC19]|nr:hypothetical protein B5D77_06360 [Microcystis sp. MC19]
MKTQGFEPRFSQNLAPVGAKQNPKTLTSSIFHIYSASLNYCRWDNYCRWANAVRPYKIDPP